MNTLRRHKHAMLLAVLVCVALIESFSHRRVLGPVLSDLFITTLLVLVFLIVFERRVNRLVAFIALATAVVVGWTHYLLPGSAELPLRLIYHSAVLLLVGFASLVILRNIFEQRVVRIDDVLGAVCGYLLAAGAWSNLFLLVEIFWPGSFSVGSGFGARLDTWHGRIAVLSYVSLGSLTSLGSGVVVPIGPPATILTTLEAVFGQFYIAVVVAQLVGSRLTQGLQRNGPAGGNV
jgi:voltage-gated potassium channel